MKTGENFLHHITYPHEDRFNGKPAAVVVLLGWYACIDRHLNKYCAIYNELGFITIRFITNPNVLLYKTEAYSTVAIDLLQILKSAELQGHQLFFHSFSNGGTHIYDQIARQLSTNQEYKNVFNVVGNIFDSSPAVAGLANLYRAVSRSSPGGKVQKMISGGLIYVYGAFLLIYYNAKAMLTGIPFKSPSTIMYETLRDDNMRHPQLCLYSKSDDISDFKWIDDFIASRRGLAVTVFEKCWDISPHVLHYQYHKQEYTDEVHRFLSYCLQEKFIPQESKGQITNNVHTNEKQKEK